MMLPNHTNHFKLLKVYVFCCFFKRFYVCHTKVKMFQPYKKSLSSFFITMMLYFILIFVFYDLPSIDSFFHSLLLCQCVSLKFQEPLQEKERTSFIPLQAT